MHTCIYEGLRLYICRPLISPSWKLLDKHTSTDTMLVSSFSFQQSNKILNVQPIPNQWHIGENQRLLPSLTTCKSSADARYGNYILASLQKLPQRQIGHVVLLSLKYFNIVFSLLKQNHIYVMCRWADEYYSATTDWARRRWVFKWCIMSIISYMMRGFGFKY